ncbi:unnamed protein product [Effrenium voratum]|uniref:Uncharacterized protein n=1 Tax=Effrenium voratum TaxID=2562239 RepID=A0AA36MZA1_9DINO|nr:unnamed protein product [Effrenium voratum]
MYDEAQELQAEAHAYERELQQRQGDRAGTLRRFKRVKQREAWNVACAQIELQRAQAEELLEDALDDAEALCSAQLEMQKAREKEEEEKETEAEKQRRRRAISRLGKQLAASAGEEVTKERFGISQDSRLLEAMAGLETLVGQRYLSGGKTLTDLKELGIDVPEPEPENPQ